MAKKNLGTDVDENEHDTSTTISSTLTSSLITTVNKTSTTLSMKNETQNVDETTTLIMNNMENGAFIFHVNYINLVLATLFFRSNLSLEMFLM